jgi:hypothetical protein
MRCFWLSVNTLQQQSLEVWQTHGSHLRNGALAVTTAHADTIYYESLFSFVPYMACLLRASGSAAPGDRLAVAVLPAADTEQEAEHITLLLSP